MNYSWLPGEGAEAFTVVFNSHNLYVHEAKLSQKLHVDFLKKNNAISSSSSSVGATACCGLWPVEKYLSICPYLSPTLSIFSLPTLEDLFPLLLSILSWVFLFVSSLPVLEWRSFWVSYHPPFSPGDPANLSFVPLFILLYFLLYSTILVLDSY